jgi:hypothetical protein
MDLIRQGNYLEAVELTQQLVESNKFTSMNEAILEVWLPVIRTESDYSDAVIERLSPRVSGLEVNEAGLAVIVDSEGEVLIEKTAPGVSNVEWAIPIVELIYRPKENSVEGFLSVIERQWKRGLLLSPNSELYGFFAVIDDLVQLEEDLELPNNQFVTTLARIYYYDAQGNLQAICVPFFTYDAKEFAHHRLGGSVVRYDSEEQLLEGMEACRIAASENKGPMTFAGTRFVDPGQIMELGFALEGNENLDDGAMWFFSDTVPMFHDEASLEAFARDGNPDVLPTVTEQNLPLLIPLSDLTNRSIREQQGFSNE